MCWLYPVPSPVHVLLVLVVGIICRRVVRLGLVNVLVRHFVNVGVDDLRRSALCKLVACGLHVHGRAGRRRRRAAVEAARGGVEAVGNGGRRAGILRRLEALLLGGLIALLLRSGSVVHLARVVCGDVLVEGDALLGDGGVGGVELGSHLEGSVTTTAYNLAVEAVSTMAADDNAVNDEGDEEEESVDSAKASRGGKSAGKGNLRIGDVIRVAIVVICAISAVGDEEPGSGKGEKNERDGPEDEKKDVEDQGSPVIIGLWRAGVCRDEPDGNNERDEGCEEHENVAHEVDDSHSVGSQAQHKDGDNELEDSQDNEAFRVVGDVLPAGNTVG